MKIMKIIVFAIPLMPNSTCDAMRHLRCHAIPTMPYNACGRADIDAHPRYDRAPHRLKVHHPFYQHPVKKIGLDSLQTPPQQGAQVCLYFLIGLIDGYLKVYNCLYDIGELAILSNTTSEFAAPQGFY